MLLKTIKISALSPMKHRFFLPRFFTKQISIDDNRKDAIPQTTSGPSQKADLPHFFSSRE